VGDEVDVLDAKLELEVVVVFAASPWIINPVLDSWSVVSS
jgi:hypothetical protein